MSVMAPLISLLPRVVLDNISPWTPFYVLDLDCKGGRERLYSILEKSRSDIKVKSALSQTYF